MNKKPILENIYQQFRQKTGFGIIIGVEQEFYADGCDKINQVIGSFPFFSPAQKERGDGQFEVNIYPTDNPSTMAEMVGLLRELVSKEETSASFLAKPFPDQPGSAMQVNINLTDDSGRNLFEKNGEVESAVFQQSIAGLLELMSASVKYFAPYDEAYARYIGGMESPSTVSWGGDNRTVSLRVPSAPIAKYTRHIEHRLPAADADPYKVITAIIAAIEFGVANKLENKHPKIFGNAFLPQYNLPKLPQSLSEAEGISHEYLDIIMSAFNKKS